MSLKKYLLKKNLLGNKIYIIALGLHSYGGLKVLIYALHELKDENLIIYLDQRCELKKIPRYKKHSYKIYNNNFFNHLIIDFKFKFLEQKFLKIYLNGIPPLFKIFNTISLFQNLNLINSDKFFDLKKIYFYILKKNIEEWLIFNSGIKKKISKIFSNKSSISIINFKIYNMPIVRKKVVRNYDFFYPASGLSHKNHKFIFDFLILCSKQKKFPSVLLTLSATELNYLNFNYYKKKFNLKLYNKLITNDYDLSFAYKSSNALIFPSFRETLGIPLYEANYFNCKIYCSNTIKCDLNSVVFFNPMLPKDLLSKIK